MNEHEQPHPQNTDQNGQKEDDSDLTSKEASAPEQDLPLESEFLAALPPEIRKVVEFGFSMQRVSGPVPNPILSKINERHIDKILDIAEKDDERSFQELLSSRKYALGYALLSSGLFVFVTVFWSSTTLLCTRMFSQ